MCVLSRWKGNIWHVLDTLSSITFVEFKKCEFDIWRDLTMKSRISASNVTAHFRFRYSVLLLCKIIPNLILRRCKSHRNGNGFYWFYWHGWYCIKNENVCFSEPPMCGSASSNAFQICTRQTTVFMTWRCEQIDCLRSPYQIHSLSLSLFQAIQEIVSFAGWYVMLMCALLESAKRNGKYDIHFFCSALFLLFLQIVCVVRGRCDNFFFEQWKFSMGEIEIKGEDKKSYA